MTRSGLVLALLLNLFLAAISVSQDSAEGNSDAESNYPKSAIKVDEFGMATHCDVSARVDNFFTQFNNNLTASGYVIAYNGTETLPAQMDRPQMIERIREAIRFRRFDDSRVTFINGGFRDEPATEMFLVPAGGIPPEPTETVKRPKPSTGTFLWNRSHFWAGEEDINSEFVLASVTAKLEEEARLEELQASLDSDKESTASIELPFGEELDVEETSDEEKLTPEEIEERRFAWADDSFANEIAKRKGSRGVIFYYADELYYDVVQIQQFVEQSRDRIASEAKIEPSRFEVQYGGYRGFPEVEYFIVPKKGKTPKPKPEERPVEEPE